MFEEKPIAQVEVEGERPEAPQRDLTPEVLVGDCREAMKSLPSASVDFAMSSIPYWNKRKAQYPGYQPGRLWEWFDPIQRELQRVMKRTGVLVINIDRLLLNGSVHPETYSLPVLMQAAGWLQVDEYIWSKSNPPRGYWPKRDVHAHEKCFVFALSPEYAFNRVKVPSKQKPEDIARRNDRLRYDWAWAETGSGSGFSHSYPCTDEVFRTNVFTAANSSGSFHPAAYRPEVPAYFIPAFCPEGWPPDRSSDGVATVVMYSNLDVPTVESGRTGAEFREWAEGVIERLGERPFGSLDTVASKTHTKSGMLRLVCPDCPNVGFPISESDLRRNGKMEHVACGNGYVREDGKPLPWER